MCILVPTSVLLTDFKIKELNGCKGILQSLLNLFFWDSRQCWAESYSFCIVPGDLCYYFGGESGHDLLNPNRPQAPHTHVLFPQLPFICGYLLFICYCTKIADQLPSCEANHLLLCMHSAAFVFQGVHHHREASCCLWWLMTVMWPFSSLCFTLSHVWSLWDWSLDHSLVEWSTHWPTP